MERKKAFVQEVSGGGGEEVEEFTIGHSQMWIYLRGLLVVIGNVDGVAVDELSLRVFDDAMN